jgi:hypothetical protein
MMTKEQLMELLKDSNWPAEEKRRLLGLVPKLGVNTINFLYKEIGTFFSEITADVVANSIEKTLFSIENIRNNPSDFISLLRIAPDSPDFDFGKYLIPIIADSRPVIPLSGSVQDSLLKFETKVFKDLPESELQFVIKDHLLYFMGQVDVLMEMKRINYFRKIGENKNWGKKYVSYLESNEELFGKRDLVMEGKSYRPNLQYWIQDYIAALPVPVSQRTTFEEIQYLKRSSNAARLSAREQQQLLEIIKLYSWFLEPFVTEEEVVEYEEKLNQRLIAAVNEISEPEVPKKQGFGFVRPMEDVEKSPVKLPPVAPAAPPVKPKVMPPLRVNAASVQEILKKASLAPTSVAPVIPAPAVVQQVSTRHADIKKSPISSMGDIIEQKKQLEKKIDEKIDELKKRVK